MVLSTKTINRIGIFFFYDNDGIVDEYVIIMIKDMLNYCKKIYMVCNGILNVKSRGLIEMIPNVEILVRDNIGYDVWAYKTTIEYIGKEELSTVDELILFNHTIIGPIEPKYTEKMFEIMDAKDVDFWGLSLYHGMHSNVWGIFKNEYMPMHLQSHFIAVRNKMLNSFEFFDYWESRPMINSYQEAVGYHEAIFTEHFEECGYTWAVYCDTRDEFEEYLYPLFDRPIDIIEKYNCPFIKRKLFYYFDKGLFQSNTNEKSMQLFSYLKNNTSYNTDIIIDNLLRTVANKEIELGLNLDFVTKEIAKENQEKYAIIIDSSYDGWKNLNYDDLLNAADVYFSGTDEEYQFLNIDRISKINILDDNSFSIYYSVDSLVGKYNYFLFLANKTQKYIDLRNDNGSFDYIVSESIIGNSKLRNDIIDHFGNDRKMGLVFPPNPLHADFFQYYRNREDDVKSKAKDILDKSGCMINKLCFNELSGHLSGSFWCRSDIINDFTKKIDYTIWKDMNYNDIYLFTSVLSLFAQFNKYYSVNTFSENLAVALSSLKDGMIGLIARNSSSDMNLASLCNDLLLKSNSPKACAYFDYGNGYNDLLKKDVFIQKNNRGGLDITIPIQGDIKEIKLVLACGSYTIVDGLKCNYNDISINPYNGYVQDNIVFFNALYPEYIIEGNFVNYKELKFHCESISYYYSKSNFDQFISILESNNKQLYLDNLKCNDYKNELINVKEKLRYKESQYGEQQEKFKNLQDEVVALNDFKEEILNSLSFKITHPFRKRG